MKKEELNGNEWLVFLNYDKKQYSPSNSHYVISRRIPKGPPASLLLHILSYIIIFLFVHCHISSRINEISGTVVSPSSSSSWNSRLPLVLLQLKQSSPHQDCYCRVGMMRAMPEKPCWFAPRRGHRFLLFFENLHFGLYSTQIRWYTATSILGEILLKNGLGCHISKKCAIVLFQKIGIQ